MRILVIGLVAVIVSATAAAAADVARPGGHYYRRGGPPAWCNQGNDMTGGVTECSYYTLQQCLVTARGVGGTCIPNPAFEWARYYQGRRHGWRY